MRAGRLVAALALGWVVTWLLLGLSQGDPTLLLRPGAASEPLKLAYLGLLYAWLLGASGWCWKRWGPRLPGWRRPGLFFLGLGIGVVSLTVHRGLLWLLGDYTPQLPALNVALIALVTSPLLALAEEMVFRGYLFGTVREDYGRAAAYLGVNGFFAVLHLLRPGTFDYKLALGLGLFLVGCVLSRWAEASGSLWPAIGLHSALIIGNVVDNVSVVQPGWLSGLRGDPAAGVLGWVLLLGLGALAPRAKPLHADD